MELTNKFANLSKALSTKFPDLDEFYLCVHILGYVSRFNTSLIFFPTGGIGNIINFDGEVLQEIENQVSLSVKNISENERKDICSYYFDKCLSFERYIQHSPTEYISFFDELIIDEFSAISKIGDEYSVDFSKFSNKSFRKFFNLEIEKYFYYKAPFIPAYLNRKLIGLAEKSGYTIYIPNCGDGSLFVEFYKKSPNPHFHFKGYARNQIEWFFCIVNLYINNIFGDSGVLVEIEYHSPFEKILEDYSYFKVNEQQGEKFENADVAISVLPFGKLSKNESDPLFFSLSHNLKSVEYAYIELMLNATNDKGKVIVVVPDSTLHSFENRYFWEAYLSRDWIEKIISLPANTFNKTSIKSSIIVFNKNKAKKNVVIFESNGKKVENTHIKTSIIKSQYNTDLGFILNTLNESKELRNILAHSQHPVKKIKDLVEILISGYNYSPNNRIAENSSEILPYVRVSDLAKDDKDFTLDISKVEREISLEKARRNTIIDFSAVLISKIAPKLKPTYFKFIGQPIVIGSDVIALKMKEDVNVEYFLTQLHSRLVQIQVEMMSSGATINRISKDDFLNIQIILPPLEEQQRQILEMRGVIKEKAIAQEKVARAEQQADAIEYEVIANMNHSLKNKLGVIINDYDTLVRFLQRKERTNSPVSFNDTIRPVFEGETIAEVDTIKLITERLKNNLLDTSKVFNTSLKLQTKELKTTPVELVSYFRNEIKPLYAGENFIIEFFAEPKLKLNVLLDKEVFKDAIDNLINNAKSHGFSDKDREYKIVFELSKLGEVYDEESQSVINYARIVYKDDGKGFPKGFSFNDYVRYSSKAGKTQGTGIGGAIVNRIVKLHNGKFNELPADEYSDFGVQFEILLPLDE